jgi:hypothetical protein
MTTPVGVVIGCGLLILLASLVLNLRHDDFYDKYRPGIVLVPSK